MKDLTQAMYVSIETLRVNFACRFSRTADNFLYHHQSLLGFPGKYGQKFYFLIQHIQHEKRKNNVIYLLYF